MPIPHLGPPVRVGVVFIAVAALLAGCGKSEPPAPNVDQVAHTMQTQVYKLLEATWTTSIQVTDPLFDKYVPCDNGRVKVTYTVTGKPITFATGTIVATSAAKKPVASSRIIADLVRYLPELGTFSIVERADQGTTVKAVNAATRTRLTLRSPGPDRLVITGETDCLAPGNLGRDVG